MEAVFNLREKNKSEDWYKSVMNTIVPFNNTNMESYEKYRLIYAILNNDGSVLFRQLYELCNPEGDMFKLPFEQDREIVIYNRLYPKFMYLVGQMLKRGDNFDVLLLSDRDNAAKDAELKKVLEAAINQELMIFQAQLEAGGANAEQIEESMRTMPKPEDIDIKNFKSEMEIFYNDVVEYFKVKFDIKSLKSLSFKHVLAVDRCFMVVIEKNGQPHPMVLNTLHCGFHKNSNEERIEKGDYWWYRTPITVTEAIDELEGKVEDDVLERLRGYTSSNYLTPNAAWDITSGQAKSQYNYLSVEEGMESRFHDNRYIGQSTGTSGDRRYRANQLIWKTYLEFKAYREVIFLTMFNEYNEVVTEVVDSKYPIPEDAATTFIINRYNQKAKRYEWIDEFGNVVYAEKMYIPRRYEITRYGYDIFTDMREVPNQPLSIDNPYDFELSCKGRIFSGLNAESISLVERALPSLLQYTFVKDLQNRELAKYEGYIKNIDASQIPDYLAMDENGNPLYEGADKLKVWRYLRRTLGDSYYDPTATTSGLPNNQRTTAVTAEQAGSIGEIVNMQQLLDLIDREMGMQMLVPPQAEGIYSPSSNVSDNQQAIAQSYTMAEEYFRLHQLVIKETVNEYVTQFTNYYRRFFENNPEKTETFLNYVTSDGMKKTIRIKPELLNHEDLGIFIHDGDYNERYRQMMTQMIQPLAQNAGEGAERISELVMAMTRGDSPEKVHKMIATAAREQEQRMQQQQQIQQQMQEQQLQAQAQMKQQDHNNKLEQITLTKQMDAEIKAMDVYKFTDDLNQDKDGVPDHIEAYKAMRGLSQKDRELDIKEKDIATKERIARISKKENTKSSK